MVSVCINTIKNIIENLILLETIICDDRDLPWMNKKKKKTVHEQNSLYKDYHKNNNTKIFQNLTLLQ